LIRSAITNPISFVIDRAPRELKADGNRTKSQTEAAPFLTWAFAKSILNRC
jgi:hypothetical protein